MLDCSIYSSSTLLRQVCYLFTILLYLSIYLSTSNALSSVTPCQNLSGMRLCCHFVGFLAVECLADFRFLMLCNAIYLCYYFPNSSVYLSLPLEVLSLPTLAGVVVSNSGDLSPEKTCMCNSEVQFSP